MKIRGYQIQNSFMQDAYYQWVTALQSHGSEPLRLQILLTSISTDTLRALVDYFHSLQLLGRSSPHCWTPDQTFCLGEPVLVAVYPDRAVHPLASILPDDPIDALPYWKQASEALHSLHRKEIVYGNLSLNSFVIEKAIVLLTGFGYYPLLQQPDNALVRQAETTLAPEIKRGGAITHSADIYSFAHCVATWRSEVRSTPWFQKATAPDPADRHPTIRALFTELQSTLELEEPPELEESILIPVTETQLEPAEPETQPDSPDRPKRSKYKHYQVLAESFDA